MTKNEYKSKMYDQINFVIPKGGKERLKKHAADRRETLNGFIKRAVAETYKRDRTEPDEQPKRPHRQKSERVDEPAYNKDGKFSPHAFIRANKKRDEELTHEDEGIDKNSKAYLYQKYRRDMGQTGRGG